jgi:ribose transport system substrate-binding protein
MRRRHFLRLAAGTGVALAAGCNEGPADKYRVVVIPKGLTHEFWQSIHRGAVRASADLLQQKPPIAVGILWDGPLRERDALAQIRIVDRRIATGVDGIVLAPQHSRTMVAPVERAVARHVPVVIIDSGLENQELIVKYVATNNYNGGWLAGQHLLKVLEAEGKTAPRLVLFRYQVGSESTEQREKGFEDHVNQYIAKRGLDPDKVWLSRDKYAGATKDSALKEAAPLVNRLRDLIDGIFAVNESAASGMLDALRSLGLNRKVRLMGFDSSQPLLQAVREGDVDGLILQDPYKMGYLGTWILVQYLEGFVVDADGKALSTGEHVITRDNVDALTTQELFDPVMQGRRTIQPPVFTNRDRARGVS